MRLNRTGKKVKGNMKAKLAVTALLAWLLTNSVLVHAGPVEASNDLCLSSKVALERLEHCSIVIARTKDRRLLERSYNRRGHANMELKRYQDAVNDFTQVIRLNPKIAGYFDNRRTAYRSMGRLEEAMKDANVAVALAPAYAFVFRNRGEIYDDLGRYDLAIRDYTKAIIIEPADSGNYFNRGRALAKAGLLREAVDDLNRAYQLDPKNVYALRERGLVRLQLKDVEGARSDLALFLGSEPNDAEVAAILATDPTGSVPRPTPVPGTTLVVPNNPSPQVPHTP